MTEEEKIQVEIKIAKYKYRVHLMAKRDKTWNLLYDAKVVQFSNGGMVFYYFVNPLKRLRGELDTHTVLYYAPHRHD